MSIVGGLSTATAVLTLAALVLWIRVVRAIDTDQRAMLDHAGLDHAG